MIQLSMRPAVGFPSNGRGSVYRIFEGVGRHANENTGPAPDPVYVERDMPANGFAEYRALRKRGGRAFVLWTDSSRQRVFARVATRTSTRWGPAVFEITGGAGEPIGTVMREPGCRGGRFRTRWTITPVGREPMVGHKGQAGWWFVWWLFFPIQAAIAALMIASIFLGGGDGDLARMPRRIRWRDNVTGAVTLDYVDDVLRVTDGTAWDRRLPTALVTLLATYPGVLAGPAWDTGQQ
ncbi:hypothetical protein [Nocardia veterana]|uniref:Uncharacterized protein n=1 Tax=Nocardia veterana TaxID=132249 RepID=A0A7X6LWF4_9NOCA|nr:hypothetical protein [Nocardia veterana]NKY85858.1 hypothetical protein [Nocardia veterana]